jgi:uncharacterized cupin superfamily protein
MESINAIAKVRFNSAKPQIVGLYKGEGFVTELLCMEPGQATDGPAGERTYYVITGTATLSQGDSTVTVAAGHVASAPAGQEGHRLTNSSQQRLVCLVTRRPS